MLHILNALHQFAFKFNYLLPLYRLYLKLNRACYFIGDDTKPKAILVSFSPWKREFVKKFIPEYNIGFIYKRFNTEPVFNWLSEQDIPLIIWGYQERDFMRPHLNKFDTIYRMEDGFLRSKQLGAMHTPPYSLVLDSQDLYYNAGAPSDLEDILNQKKFTHDQIQQAAQCIEKLKQSGVSKYNVATPQSLDDILGEKAKQRVLVVGQVEEDASIKMGCVKQITNNDLVRLAHKENPEADIIYKIHPDVIAKKRKKISNTGDVSGICTILEQDVRPADLFKGVDKVYTITSLMGFEALIYGLKVTCYGLPFYAGWGLTDDRQPCSRRTAKLSLEEVFAGAYLLYPRYYDTIADKPVIITEIIDALS